MSRVFRAGPNAHCQEQLEIAGGFRRNYLELLGQCLENSEAVQNRIATLLSPNPPTGVGIISQGSTPRLTSYRIFGHNFHN